jgi:hypothetical protein
MSRGLPGIVFSASLTLLFSGAKAKAETLGELTQECAQLESYWKTDPPTHQSTTVPNNADAAICFGHIKLFEELTSIIGVVGDPDVSTCSVTQDGKPTGGPRCRLMLGVCTPQGVSYSQLLAVFLAYARSHAAQWHERAGFHFLSALTAAFPCK